MNNLTEVEKDEIEQFGGMTGRQVYEAVMGEPPSSAREILLDWLLHLDIFLYDGRYVEARQYFNRIQHVIRLCTKVEMMELD